VGEYTEKYDAAVLFMQSKKADNMPHSDSDLLSHLRDTADLLESWGNSEDICLAGLCHAVYGTEGFKNSMLDISEREILVQIIGEAAEELVYFYASAERDSFSPSINRERVKFRDRFTGEVFEPNETMLRHCLELMLANDIEISSRWEQFRRYTQPYNSELFTRCKNYVSEAGFDSMCKVYDVGHEAAS